MVLARDGGAYRVLLDDVERVAILRGKAQQGDRAVAGDVVRIDPATIGEETLAIEAVEPRRSLLERRTPEGRGTRPVAANIDQVLVVTAVADPAPLLQLIDRLLVVAEANEIAAVVVANKSDIGDPAPISGHLRAAGYQVLVTSARTGDGIDALRDQLHDRTSVLTGASGTGKSSLLNAVEPGLSLRIGAISEKVRRGTHTTTTAAMVPLSGGGFVVDTPGFSEVGVWNLHPADLAMMFPELVPYADECRFADCHHRSEPGCAVIAAVTAGVIPATRHENYLAILAELEAMPADWE